MASSFQDVLLACKLAIYVSKECNANISHSYFAAVAMYNATIQFVHNKRLMRGTLAEKIPSSMHTYFNTLGYGVMS